MLGIHGRKLSQTLMLPPARFFASLGIGPTFVTWFGAVVSIGAAIGLLATGRFLIGIIILAFSTGFDALDGTLARLTGKESEWGAFLDSMIDRVVDGAVFLSVAVGGWLYLPQSWARTLWVVSALLATLGSQLVSYARAKAESLGLHATVGIAERTDRLVLGGIGVGISGATGNALFGALCLCWVALSSFITVGQRILVVRRQLMARNTTS